MEDKLNKKLEDRIEKGTLRSLSSFQGMIDFLSNDYLGFGKERVDFSGNLGSTGSRLIAGNDNDKEFIEEELARFFGFEAGLIFNSGYDANLGIFSSIPQKGEIVIYDELIHASVRDGLRLSLAKSYSFRHNDVSHLKQLLEKSKGVKIYVAVESLYSMNGDKSPLKALSALCEQYDASLIVDEAHAAGVYGIDGKGLCYGNVQPSIQLVTFGKAYGGHGAIVLCSELIRKFLINYARSFIYTTALSTDLVRHIAKRVMNDNVSVRQIKLRQNIALFRNELKLEHLESDVDSPIQIIQFDKETELRSIETKILGNNIAVKAIYPPTVPNGSACLRICLHSFNTEAEIRKLVRVIS